MELYVSQFGRNSDVIVQACVRIIKRGRIPVAARQKVNVVKYRAR